MESETPNKPVRLKKFAIFFKGYMGVSSIVTAALPIPVTAFRLLPVLGVHRKVLSVYTPLFCFLVLGFIFYSRHTLARHMFPCHTAGKVNYRTVRLVKSAPGVFIVLSLISIIGYHMKIDNIAARGAESPQDSIQQVLDYAPTAVEGAALVGLYVSIFIFAEAAFIIMALKEYMQDVIGISDRKLLGIEEKAHEPPPST